MLLTLGSNRTGEKEGSSARGSGVGLSASLALATSPAEEQIGQYESITFTLAGKEPEKEPVDLHGGGH